MLRVVIRLAYSSPVQVYKSSDSRFTVLDFLIQSSSFSTTKGSVFHRSLSQMLAARTLEILVLAMISGYNTLSSIRVTAQILVPILCFGRRVGVPKVVLEKKEGLNRPQNRSLDKSDSEFGSILSKERVWKMNPQLEGRKVCFIY